MRERGLERRRFLYLEVLKVVVLKQLVLKRWLILFFVFSLCVTFHLLFLCQIELALAPFCSRISELGLPYKTLRTLRY